jgi:trehalose 2-sulfotransferase
MEPTYSYIICATPRSGSHLLCEALASTKLAGKPDEYFITHEGRLENETGNIAEQFGQMTLPEFRDFVVGVGSTPNGAFGISILWGDFEHILRNYRTLPEFQNLNDREVCDKLFNNPKYIWLTRQDKVRQAVSLEKAIQTDVWRKSTHEQFEARQEPKFDFEKVDFRRRRLEESDAGWQKFFAQHDITPFNVVYEELVHTYEETAINILDFLGIPHPDTIEFGPRRLQKLADKQSEEWVASYLEIKNAPLTQATEPITGLKWRIQNTSIREWFRKRKG